MSVRIWRLLYTCELSVAKRRQPNFVPCKRERFYQRETWC
jgi:hypothetical protein